MRRRNLHVTARRAGSRGPESELEGSPGTPHAFPQSSAAAAMEAGRSAVLRVRRKRSAEPAEALVLACKRLRSSAVESAAQRTPPEDLERAAENNVFQLVATVRSQVLGRDGVGMKGILGRSRGEIVFLTLSRASAYTGPLSLPPPRRNQSSRSCGPPCDPPGAASCVSAAASALLLGISGRRAATEWSLSTDPRGFPWVSRSPKTLRKNQKPPRVQASSCSTWSTRKETQRPTPGSPAK